MATAETKTRPSTWDVAVLACLRSRGSAVPLSALYIDVRQAAPQLVENNPQHYADKVRQVVQRLAKRGLAERVGRGVWKATRA